MNKIFCSSTPTVAFAQRYTPLFQSCLGVKELSFPVSSADDRTQANAWRISIFPVFFNKDMTFIAISEYLHNYTDTGNDEGQ